MATATSPFRRAQIGPYRGSVPNSNTAQSSLPITLSASPTCRRRPARLAAPMGLTTARTWRVGIAGRPGDEGRICRGGIRVGQGGGSPTVVDAPSPRTGTTLALAAKGAAVTATQGKQKVSINGDSLVRQAKQCRLTTARRIVLVIGGMPAPPRLGVTPPVLRASRPTGAGASGRDDGTSPSGLTRA